MFINFYDTGKVKESKVIEYIKANIDLSPYGIIKKLDLRRPIYQQTATYGHFGRDPNHYVNFTWEKLDLVSGFASLL